MTPKKPDSKAAKAQSLPVGSINAPRFGRLHNGRLQADSLGDGSEVWIERRAPANLLHRFIKIANAPDTQRAVIAFVRQWGILQLPKLGLPIFHKPAAKEKIDTTDGYFHFARLLESLLTIGLDLQNGHIADAVVWELADSFLYGDPDPLLLDHFPRSAVQRDRQLAAARSSLPRARKRFQEMIRLLTIVARLQPRFTWSHGIWAIDFDCFHGSNLAAILTIQLMAAIGGQTMRKCRTCPRWFVPSGRQVYCKGCGIRAAWRHAKKRQRQGA